MRTVLVFVIFMSHIVALAKSSENGQNRYVNVTLLDTVTGDVPLTLAFKPPFAERIVEGKTRRVYVNHSYPGVDVRLRVRSQDPDIAKIAGSDEILLTDVQEDGNGTGAYFEIEGVFLGRTRLTFDARLGNVTKKFKSSHTKSDRGYTFDDDEDDDFYTKNFAGRFEEWERLPVTYRVSVIRQPGAVDAVFMGIIFLMVILANIGMGSKIDLEVIKEVLKRPFAPIIGFCSQFIFMPLLAFGIVKLIGLEGGQGLGFFLMGCAPGGGASNMYTYVLGGDVSLSITMTLISTVASLGMIPLWLYTLGQTLLDREANIRIPFENIFGTLALIVIPVGVGVLIQKKRPKWAELIGKILKPIFIVFIIFIFTFGIWANLYIFKLFTPKLIICACLLPYCGFLLGGSLAFICRQSLPRIIAICIETGIQNTGVPILMLKFSLPPPEGALSIVSPIATSTFTPIPLWIAIAVNEARKRLCPPKADEKADEDNENRGEEMVNMEATKMLKEKEKKEIKDFA